ncbi:anti-repressor SinI family protein [Peribacillus simplex]|nr:anti-repressor SinI family protein [Peribacillus simplex]WHY58319.1 anti-repressor SinI family protein [Peribacillus simplex]
MHYLNSKDLDREWAELIVCARELGISIDEIREFLNQSSRPDLK